MSEHGHGEQGGHGGSGEGSKLIKKVVDVAIGMESIKETLKAGPLGAVESDGKAGGHNEKHDDHHKPKAHGAAAGGHH